MIILLCAASAAGIFVWTAFFGPIHCRFPDDAEHDVQTRARILRSAVQSWQTGNSSMGCPNFAQLNSTGYIDPAQSVMDPWGTEYGISCVDDEVIVSSAGPDRRWDTLDDTSIPRRGGIEAR